MSRSDNAFKMGSEDDQTARIVSPDWANEISELILVLRGPSPEKEPIKPEKKLVVYVREVECVFFSKKKNKKKKKRPTVSSCRCVGVVAEIREKLHLLNSRTGTSWRRRWSCGVVDSNNHDVPRDAAIS